jgi:hypothetical protein
MQAFISIMGKVFGCSLDMINKGGNAHRGEANNYRRCDHWHNKFYNIYLHIFNFEENRCKITIILDRFQ